MLGEEEHQLIDPFNQEQKEQEHSEADAICCTVLPRIGTQIERWVLQKIAFQLSTPTLKYWISP
jgi:hypothetical protein